MITKDKTLAELCEDVALTERNAAAVAEYLAHLPPDGRMGISLTWTWGNRMDDRGYLILCREMKELVEADFRRHAQVILQKLKKEAEVARLELKAVL